MKQFTKYLTILILSLLLLLFIIPIKSTFASYHYKEWKDNIVLNKDGTIDVEENLSIYFGSHDGGQAYHWFKRWINLNKIESITDVQVFEDNNGNLVPYKTGDNTPGTFSAYREGNSAYIKLNYETKDTVKHFVIKYRILGAAKLGTVAFYEKDTSFDYIAIPPKNEVTIDKAIVDVHIPEGASKDEIKAWGAGLAPGSGNVNIVSGDEVILKGSQIAPGQFIEFNIVFPRGIVEEPLGVHVYPGSAADKAKAQAEAAARKAKMAGLKILLGLLLFVFIIAWIFLTWYRKGKDIILPEYAEYLKDPPTDLSPAIAGALLKQGATIKEVIATLLDLADRGYIKIEEMDRTFGKKDYVYELINRDFSKLKLFEKKLIEYVFGGLDSIRLSDLKYEFSRYLPKIYSKINQELVWNEFYEGGSPAKVKGKYFGIGFGMIFIGFFLLVWLGIFKLPFIAWPILLGGIVIVLFAPAMPRKSMKGAQERMKWLAFKRYLEGLVKYKKVEEAKNLFSKYLPFAVIFGIDKHWIKAFSRANAPAPIWYVPYYRGGYNYENTGGLSSTEGFGKVGGNITNSMKGFSLDSISNGLNSLLNSSASVFTSTKGSSSGGGGGFSGGGGFGGGGGGGSSAG